VALHFVNEPFGVVCLNRAYPVVVLFELKERLFLLIAILLAEPEAKNYTKQLVDTDDRSLLKGHNRISTV
jgi:hypothetical protein